MTEFTLQCPYCQVVIEEAFEDYFGGYYFNHECEHCKKQFSYMLEVTLEAINIKKLEEIK